MLTIEPFKNAWLTKEEKGEEVCNVWQVQEFGKLLGGIQEVQNVQEAEERLSSKSVKKNQSLEAVIPYEWEGILHFALCFYVIINVATNILMPSETFPSILPTWTRGRSVHLG